jgi:hypothetical protein
MLREIKTDMLLLASNAAAAASTANLNITRSDNRMKVREEMWIQNCLLWSMRAVRS